MTEEGRNVIFSFILGVVLTSIYFSVPHETSLRIYVVGVGVSIILTFISGYMGAVNRSQENKKHNLHWNSSKTQKDKEENPWKIIAQEAQLRIIFLLIALSWIGAIFLGVLFIQHFRERFPKPRAAVSPEDSYSDE